MMDYYKLIYNHDISFKGHAFMSDYDSLYIKINSVHQKIKVDNHAFLKLLIFNIIANDT